VLDSPAELHALIEQKNQSANKARVVAGYCWGWPSKKDPKAFDIELPQYNYRRQWNLTQDGSLWIMAPKSVAQVGCIHTCQGLEVDHVGVIIDPDLVYRDGRIPTNHKVRAKSDKIQSHKPICRQRGREFSSPHPRILKKTWPQLKSRHAVCKSPWYPPLPASRVQTLPVQLEALLRTIQRQHQS
jgi:uncharacterized protein